MIVQETENIFYDIERGNILYDYQEESGLISIDDLSPEFQNTAEDYVCCICQYILNKPVSCCNCKNSYCKVCIDKWISKHQNNKCPNRCEYKSEQFNPILSKTLESFRIECEKCKQKLQINKSQSHWKICQERRIRCNLCQIELIRKEAKDHIFQCKYALYKCNFCFIKLKKLDLDSHIDICSNEKINCPFCNEMIIRRDSEQHSRSCSEIKIECELCKDTIEVNKSHGLLDCVKRMIDKNEAYVKNKIDECDKKVNLANSQAKVTQDNNNLLIIENNKLNNSLNKSKNTIENLNKKISNMTIENQKLLEENSKLKSIDFDKSLIKIESKNEKFTNLKDNQNSDIFESVADYSKNDNLFKASSYIKSNPLNTKKEIGIMQKAFSIIDSQMFQSKISNKSSKNDKINIIDMKVDLISYFSNNYVLIGSSSKVYLLEINLINKFPKLFNVSLDSNSALINFHYVKKAKTIAIVRENQLELFKVDTEKIEVSILNIIKTNQVRNVSLIYSVKSKLYLYINNNDVKEILVVDFEENNIQLKKLNVNYIMQYFSVCVTKKYVIFGIAAERGMDVYTKNDMKYLDRVTLNESCSFYYITSLSYNKIEKLIVVGGSKCFCLLDEEFNIIKKITSGIPANIISCKFNYSYGIVGVSSSNFIKFYNNTGKFLFNSTYKKQVTNFLFTSNNENDGNVFQLMDHCQNVLMCLSEEKISFMDFSSKL